jgi:diguanylate cyclase (GGDEF)-like protein
MLRTLRDIHEIIKREGQDCSIVMLDIDDFKSVNDTFGHAAGDRILREVTHYIFSQLRPYDKLFRYGGEEFIICMQNTNTKTCQKRVEHIRKGIETLDIEIGQRVPINLTISFGIAPLLSSMTVTDSIDCADKAMYKAKQGGKNRTEVYELEQSK